MVDGWRDVEQVEWRGSSCSPQYKMVTHGPVITHRCDVIVTSLFMATTCCWLSLWAIFNDNSLAKLLHTVDCGLVSWQVNLLHILYGLRYMTMILVVEYRATHSSSIIRCLLQELGPLRVVASHSKERHCILDAVSLSLDGDSMGVNDECDAEGKQRDSIIATRVMHQCSHSSYTDLTLDVLQK